MFTLLIILHVLFCLFMILVILLQAGKGSGMGAAFGGGGSQTVFGPRGAGSFIGRLTGVVATLFMLSSLTLAYLSSSGESGVRERVEALNREKAKDVQNVEIPKTEDKLDGIGVSEQISDPDVEKESDRDASAGDTSAGDVFDTSSN